MTAYARSLWAEILKLRRTLALWMCLISPMVVVAIEFFLFLRLNPSFMGDDFDGWDFLIRNSFGVWVLLMLPLFVTLETALLAGVEHSDGMWKHLFALPVPRGAMYTAKQIVGLALVGISMVVLVVGMFLSGWLIQVFNLKPGASFAPLFPWQTAFQVALLVFLMSWLIIAIHTWVAVRWRNFPFAIGIGIAATIVNFFLVNNEQLSHVFPWSLPLNALNSLVNREPVVLLPLTLGVVGGIVVAFIGGWEVTRRDVL